MGLSDGERILMMRSAVLTQITRVTDRRTDRRTDGIGVAYTRYSIYAVARKNRHYRPPRRRSCHRHGSHGKVVLIPRSNSSTPCIGRSKINVIMGHENSSTKECAITASWRLILRIQPHLPTIAPSKQWRRPVSISRKHFKHIK